MYLVLLETSGNQNYIFATNKLRENIGASELTYRAGTQWVMDAVAEINDWPQSRVENIADDSTNLRNALLDRQFNRSISEAEVEVEILIATSGKALLLVKEEELGKQIIRYVTKRALTEAPGLDICGVISDRFNWEENRLGEMNQQVHQKFESVRGARPSPDTRFLRLSVVAECATSGLPAMGVETEGDRNVLRSAVSQYKRNSSQRGFERIQSLLHQRNTQLNFLKNIANFETEFKDNFDENISCSWLSVIHADGNGLGQIFLDFGKYMSHNRDYVDAYRKFSIAIDICTERAFLDAIESVFIDKNPIPLVPLILGGDDLTVVCDGRYALQFTQQFLTKFEEYTSKRVDLPSQTNSDIIIDRANKHLSYPRLSACAGITVMKNHFPFSIAYHLAEQLIKSAKTVKEIVKNHQHQTVPCSAIDYHILYDSVGVDLKNIRDKLEFPHPPTHLYSRPYIVSPSDWYGDSDRGEWIERHHWQNLTRRVTAINDKDEEGKYRLPNSQIHDLREGLFLGKDGADSRYQLVRDRYLDRKITDLEGEDKSLFWLEDDIYNTGLLDAIDAAGFWKGVGENE